MVNKVSLLYEELKELEIKEALKKALGNNTATCSILKISLRTLFNYYNKYPSLKEYKNTYTSKLWLILQKKIL